MNDTIVTAPASEPVIQWDDEMVLGNAQLDAVHHEMSDLLNRLAMTPES